MADFEQLKASVASIIRTNGAEAITGAVLQDVLLTIINSISDGYMFGGVAQHSGSVGNPDYNVFYLGGSGSYTGYGGSIDVPAGSYCVFEYDGTWHQSVIDLGISLGGTVSEGETQGVTGDAVNTALNTLWENITNILDSIEFSDDTSELYKGDRITQGMRATLGGALRLLSSFTILAATVQKAGLMSAADKRKLDNFVYTVQDMIETMTVSDVTGAGDTGTRIDESIEWTVDEVTHQIATFTLLAATAVKAGLMSNTDKQAVDALFTIEAEDTTAVDDLGVKLTETLNWTVNNVSQIFAEFTLLAATQSKAGLMSAADKAKLDAYENNIRSMEIVDTTGNADKGDQITETLRWVFGGVSTVITTFTLLAATHTKAGLMSAVDKQLVDALLTIIAQDTTAQADEKTSITQSLKWTRGGTQQTMASFSILAATAEKAGLMSADDKAKIDAMLTGGYMFAGVATTSTNPTTGTEKMFYIAVEAGEYTHFDGLMVDRGINILMYDGSGWNAVTVVGIDVKPAKSSSNLIESGAVYNSVTPLEDAASSKDAKPIVDIISGYIINSSGTQTANENYSILKYNAIAGRKYSISVYRSAAASEIYYVNWFNSSNEFISHEIDSVTETSSAITVVCETPTNAAYCMINVANNYKGYVSFLLLSDGIEAERLLVGVRRVFNPKALEFIAATNVSEGKYMNSSLSEITETGFDIMYYPVEGGKYYLLNTGVNTINSVYAAYWFAADDKFLCREPINDTWKYENYVMRAPDNAVKVAINRHKSNTPYGANLAKITEFFPISYEDKIAELNVAISDFEDVEKSETIENSWLRTNGVSVTADGFECWIYEVTPNSLYAFSGAYPVNTNISFIAILDNNKELLEFLQYAGSTLSAVEYIDKGFITPANASYVLLNVRKKSMDKFNLKKVIKQLPIKDVKDISEINNVLAEYNKAEYNNIIDGKLIKSDGTEMDYPSGEYYEYTVAEGEQYRIKVCQPAVWSGIRVYVLKDDEDNVLSVGPTKSVGDDPVFFDITLSIPEGATKLYINNSKRQSVHLSVGKYKGYIDVSGMQDAINALSEQSKGTMKVVISGLNSSFYIRTSYNSEKDIIVTHGINNNGLISFDSAYVGEKELSDAEMMKSSCKVSEHTDSTAPIRSYPQYWHLFAQHGYPVPYFANTMNMTTSDVGAEWKDQLDRHFTIGKVTDSYVWLLPVIYQNASGHYTRDWRSLATSEAITTLIHVSGGTYTSTISFEEGSILQEQLRPIMSVNNRTFLCDGNEIKEAGTYYCDEFQVNETEVGYDPATIQDWFGGENGKPDLTGAQVQAIFTYSYNYKGAQCCVNTTIHIIREAKGLYGGTQQQFFFDKGDYKAMFMLPKAATINNIELDKPFNSPNAASPSIHVYRNAENLKDVDNPVDRQIGFLYDDDNDEYLVGMAAGLSLVSGDTVITKRNINMPVGKEIVLFSPTNINKFYVIAVDSSVFQSGYYPAGYFKEINYYVSYFDPAENEGQVYWYKDGNDYIIYAHCQSEQHALGINVPKFMDGLGLEIVEKTSDTDLLTDRIANGKFFVNYNSSDANYIVLKTK